MTTRRNLIIPGSVRYDAKIAIYVDTFSGATELKVEQGKLGHVQALGILMEHATNLLRNMVATRTAPPGGMMTAGNGTDPIPPQENNEGGNDNVS